MERGNWEWRTVERFSTFGLRKWKIRWEICLFLDLFVKTWYNTRHKANFLFCDMTAIINSTKNLLRRPAKVKDSPDDGSRIVTILVIGCGQRGMVCYQGDPFMFLKSNELRRLTRNTPSLVQTSAKS
jgi:hypothetical protein